MARLAVLVGNMFEDVEYTVPVAAFKEAGHQVVNVGMREGEVVLGKKDGTPVRIDASVSDVGPDDFDALFIPGGYSPDQLRVHPEPVTFVKEFVESEKLVLLICHAPQLLVTARVLHGRRVTGWPSIRQDVLDAGADFVEQEVVVDRNLVSAGSPKELQPFVTEALDRLSHLRS